MNFSIILAIDSKNGLGKENALAWKLSGDMKYFKKTTVLTDNPDDINVVIMGRKTWESIPSKFRPLPGRINCVLTRNPPHIPPSQGGGNQGCVYFESLDSCLEEIENMKNV
jgi:dihydrofolate reductase